MILLRFFRSFFCKYVRVCSVYLSVLLIDGFYQRKKKRKKKRGYIAKETSHKHNKDLNRLRYLAPGMQVNARYINSAKGTSSE